MQIEIIGGGELLWSVILAADFLKRISCIFSFNIPESGYFYAITRLKWWNAGIAGSKLS